MWSFLSLEFWFRENVIQKTKGRNGQTKKTGFLLLFKLRFKVRLCLTEQTIMIWNRLQHFPFESTTEIRPEWICRRRTWPSSCHTWTCRCCTLNKESQRSVTCKLATLIWSFWLSLAYSSTNKSNTGKCNTSVVHGLHTSQLLLRPTEIWFVHRCR